jgi:uncharacterized delta-60 repeat protein
MRCRHLPAKLAVLVSFLTMVAGPTAVQADMPDAPTTALAEPLAGYVSQDECSPVAKPGVVAFQQLLMARYPGSRNLGIVRQCHLGSRSEHKEGRAFDWGVRVDRPTEAAYAKDLIAWLLATGPDGARYANARRVGIMYMIWNRKVWSASRPADGWREYTGPSPHTDHVHFSFTWPAAYKLTSYWTGTTYGRGSDGGRLDTSYGTSGWTAYSTARATRLVGQLQRPDGTAVAVGQSAAGLVLGAVGVSGRPVGAFGGSSRVTLRLPEGTTIRSAALAADGAVVVAGSVPVLPELDPLAPPTPDPTEPQPQNDLLLARVLPSGTLDAGFDADGVATFDAGGEDESAAIAVNAAGDALVAGTTVADGISRVTVAKVSRAGLLVPGFGTAGISSFSGRGAASGSAVLSQADGKTVVGCATATAACLARLTPAGLLDASFGIGGIAVHTTMRRVNALIAGPAPLLLAAGSGTTGNPTVLRLTTSGARDSRWARSGVGAVVVPNCTGVPSGLKLRSDGSVLMASHTVGCPYSASVARFFYDGSLDPRWGSDGVAGVGVSGPGSVRAAGVPAIQAAGQVVLPVEAGGSAEHDMTSVSFTTVGPVPSRLASVRSAPTTLYGTPVTVYGVVRSTADNRRTAGVPVTLYEKRYGATTWTAVSTRITDANGVAAFRPTPTAGTAYYTKSARTTRVLAATSGVTSVAVAPSLTTPLAAASVAAGTPVDLKVTSRSAHAGSRVQLQRYRDGRWEVLGTPVLDANGVARFRLLSLNPLVRPYRWVLPAHSDHAVGVSRTVRVTWNTPTGR